jgi:hypothetical protein
MGPQGYSFALALCPDERPPPGPAGLNPLSAPWSSSCPGRLLDLLEILGDPLARAADIPARIAESLIDVLEQLP